jgi:hypothetical protein
MNSNTDTFTVTFKAPRGAPDAVLDRVEDVNGAAEPMTLAEASAFCARYRCVADLFRKGRRVGLLCSDGSLSAPMK